MPTVRHVFTLDYVAGILDEHPDLIDAIVSNDDNLSYGSIITVCAGPDKYMTAITDGGIDELRDFIADFRRSPEEWDALLRTVIDDQTTIENVKAHKPR
ncbi:hypothetical protein [Novosphingobium sp. KN65.2]|uniref:hypothetical protein n=1 Tax=Novosphingobium sp. KN65.2 TaxID=1478134 RepID=UPI0005DA9D88|nr:hypothetical protein [Novosphingobium sp. KN65.2]CDO36425.1 conserved hypothetical protein [Novosphingobium sp. KN65.2]